MSLSPNVIVLRDPSTLRLPCNADVKSLVNFPYTNLICPHLDSTYQRHLHLNVLFPSEYIMQGRVFCSDPEVYFIWLCKSPMYFKASIMLEDATMFLNLVHWVWLFLHPLHRASRSIPRWRFCSHPQSPWALEWDFLIPWKISWLQCLWWEDFCPVNIHSAQSLTFNTGWHIRLFRTSCWYCF